jgi:hypothetical protein
MQLLTRRRGVPLRRALACASALRDPATAGPRGFPPMLLIILILSTVKEIRLIYRARGMSPAGTPARQSYGMLGDGVTTVRQQPKTESSDAGNGTARAISSPVPQAARHGRSVELLLGLLGRPDEILIDQLKTPNRYPAHGFRGSSHHENTIWFTSTKLMIVPSASWRRSLIAPTTSVRIASPV